ncbi:MAG: methylated-DNA--[protein]-cysteine S-methyltransferase [Lysobacter sp.]|nr:methylated-DNA--[protein]-cysteine S-methyltransferase [Lysobacter sp.]
MKARRIFHRIHESPVGPLLIAVSDAGVHAIEFQASRHPVRRDARWEADPHPLLDEVALQLDQYFAGDREEFDLPLAPEGTEFQRSVWRALSAIPFGQTRSYADIAHVIGNPNAVRAVGAANGRNPIPIVVPCHRVIGADGALTGFGGGLPTKRFLLAHEGVRGDGDLFD